MLLFAFQSLWVWLDSFEATAIFFLPLPLPLGNFSKLHKHISGNVNLYNSVKNKLSISKKCGHWHYIHSRWLVIIVWCLNLCIVASILVLRQCFVWMQVVETCSLNSKLQFVNFQSHMPCMYSSSSCINCTQAFISSVVGALSCTAGLYCVVS